MSYPGKFSKRKERKQGREGGRKEEREEEGRKPGRKRGTEGGVRRRFTSLLYGQNAEALRENPEQAYHYFHRNQS